MSRKQSYLRTRFLLILVVMIACAMGSATLVAYVILKQGIHQVPALNLDEMVRRISYINLGITAVLVAIAVVLGGVLIRKHILAPIARLMTGAQKFAQGHFEQKVDLDIRSDFHPLAHAFNNIAATLKAFTVPPKQLQASEKAIQQARQEAEQAVDNRGPFLANISHEIRTPMNSIIGMTGILLETDLQQGQRQYVESIKFSANSLLSLVNDILAFFTIEAGRLEFEELDFDLWQTMEELSEMLGFQAQQKQLEFSFFIEDEIPCLLKGDPGRLRQVLINLAANAIEFTQQGSVSIRLTLDEETDDKALIRFSIKDTGIGIPPDRLDTLFTPVSRVDSSIAKSQGGTGIGLSISRRLCEMMDGRIGAQNNPEGGSTFWFTACFRKQSKSAVQQMVLSADIRDKRILAVDDNAANREILKSYLQRWDCRHEVVGSAPEALNLLYKATRQDDAFDLAIVDHMMPDMDGETLGKAIHASTALKKIKLILLTSMGIRGDAGFLKTIGFDAYLQKPIRRRHLFDCIRMIFGHQAEGDPQQASRTLITRHTLAEQERRKLRILIAEDNPVNQKVVLHTLQKLGFNADAVSDGSKAVSVMQTTPYDIIFMDIQMPEMDGLQATRQIRINEKAAGNQAVIIALTANAMKGDRETCLAAGMDDYLAKPVTPQQLIDTLRKWLQHLKEKSDTANQEDRQEPFAPDKAPTMADDQPPMDYEQALLRNMGNRAFLREKVADFLECLPLQLNDIAQHIQNNDTHALMGLANAVKGAGSNLSMGPLSEIAFALERCGRNAELGQATALVADLQAEAERVRGYLNQQEMN